MKLKQKLIDALLICGMILPFLLCIVLKILTAPVTDGISITGAQIYFIIPLPLQDLPITESQVVSLAVLLTILFLCLFLTRNMKIRPESHRQIIAEYLVEAAENLVKDKMGDFFLKMTPFIAAIMAASAFSSLSSLLGIYPPTADLNIIAGWAVGVFFVITYYKLQGGVFNYIKGFFSPIPLFAPMNVLGEVSTPLSMTFRHYGNVLSGVCISALVGMALGGLTNTVFSFLPADVLATFPPIFRIGIPAVLSIYFDVFSGVLQAFIFAMLTMLNIATGFPKEDYEARMAKKAAGKRKASA